MPRPKKPAYDERQFPLYCLDPEDSPEFHALPIREQTLIRAALEWMLDMDSSASPHQRSIDIAEGYKGTDTEEKKYTGLSAKSIYRRYLEWVKSGRDWRSLILYKKQKTPRIIRLQTYGITAWHARDFCLRQGFHGVADWARQHGYSPQAVSRALRERTPGKRSQEFYDTLIKAMRDEPTSLHRQSKALREGIAEIQKQVSALSLRLDDFEKQLPPV